MELRQYARAKRALEEAEHEEDVPASPMVEWVWEIQQDLAREAMRRRAEAAGTERRCVVCAAPAAYFCDGPGCAAPLCDAHRISAGDLDYCPSHASSGGS